jgi:hypothetical protein
VLGDQEVFVLKYTWELSVYFGFFVFPFINDLAIDTEFVPAFLSRFSRLGDMNAKVQQFLSDFYQWKQCQGLRADGPLFHDFTQLEPLKRAEQTFYRVGVSREEAKQTLDEQLANLHELARFLVAHVCSVVLGDPRVLTSRSFVECIDLKHLTFDPALMRAACALCAESGPPYDWTFDPHALRAFGISRGGAASPARSGGGFVLANELAS